MTKTAKAAKSKASKGKKSDKRKPIKKSRAIKRVRPPGISARLGQYPAVKPGKPGI